MSGPSYLNIQPTGQYDFIMQQSSGYQSVAVYRPQVASGFYFLGDHAQALVSSGGLGSSITVQEQGSSAELLQPPTGYVRVFPAEGYASSSDSSIWAPIAPAGYFALGHVALAAGQSTSDITNLMCVRWDQVSAIAPGELIWTNNYDQPVSDYYSQWVSVYAVPQLGTFLAQPTLPQQVSVSNYLGFASYTDTYTLTALEV